MLLMKYPLKQKLIMILIIHRKRNLVMNKNYMKYLNINSTKKLSKYYYYFFQQNFNRLYTDVGNYYKNS